jgi:hypothetical protein
LLPRFFGVGYGSSLSWDLDLPNETRTLWLQLPVLPIYSFYPGDYRSRDKVMPERMPHIRVNALFVEQRWVRGEDKLRGTRWAGEIDAKFPGQTVIWECLALSYSPSN